MKNKKDLNFMGITPEAMTLLRDMKKKVESGEEDDQQIIEALNAIDIASRVVNTIMSGNQIDPVFFKQLTDITERKILSPVKKEAPKKLKKKRKFKRKE